MGSSCLVLLVPFSAALGMGMSKKPRENRVPIMMSDDELSMIDDWRFANRVATRSDAVRRLVQIALRFDEASKRMGEVGWSVVPLIQELERLLKRANEIEEREYLQLYQKVSGIIYDLLDVLAYMDLQRSHLGDPTVALDEALKQAQSTFEAYKEDGTL